MFRIELFVDDKRLGDVLKALSGMCRVSTPQYVANVIEENEESAANGALRAVVHSGKLSDMFIAHLRQTHKSEITPTDVQDWLKKIGRAQSSSNYLANQLISNGVLKRTGFSNRTVYEVINPFVNPKYISRTKKPSKLRRVRGPNGNLMSPEQRTKLLTKKQPTEEIILIQLVPNIGDKFNTTELVNHLKAQGCHPHSYGTIVKKLMNDGTLRRLKPGEYERLK